MGLGCRVEGFGFFLGFGGLEGLGCRVWGFGFFWWLWGFIGLRA